MKDLLCTYSIREIIWSKELGKNRENLTYQPTWGQFSWWIGVRKSWTSLRARARASPWPARYSRARFHTTECEGCRFHRARFCTALTRTGAEMGEFWSIRNILPVDDELLQTQVWWRPLPHLKCWYRGKCHQTSQNRSFEPVGTLTQRQSDLKYRVNGSGLTRPVKFTFVRCRQRVIGWWHWSLGHFMLLFRSQP